MKFIDHYRVLGVSATATAAEIKTAYRALARKHHPDVSKATDAEQRFSAISEANDVLNDPAKRASFDALLAGGLRDGQEMDAPPTARGYRPRSRSAADDGGHARRYFESLFDEEITGESFHMRGADLHHTLAVSLEEAFHGGQRSFILETPAIDAHGRVTLAQRTISLTIPTGVVAGTIMRLRGQGRPGSAPDLAGELYLTIELSPHRLYRVDDQDVSLEVPIAPWEAVLGGKVAVPTLGGTVDATIPAGAVSGQRLRLKGRGLPGDMPGDQYLTLRITVPTVVSDKARELYRALARESAFNPRADLGT